MKTLILQTNYRTLFTRAFIPTSHVIKMCLSHSPQSSLSTQSLSASMNAVCLSSSKMFMIVTLSSCMGSFQRMMKSMSSFNTRTVTALRHIDKSWLKTIIFSNNESLPRYFSRALFRFSLFLVISQNHRLIKIKSKNTNGEFRASMTILARVPP